MGNVEIVLDDAITDDQYGLHRSGTSDQWRERVAAPLAGNSNVVLGVGTSLAGPLLPWADEPGGGFHSHGPAKTGKTLIGAVDQSVWGKPYRPGAGADAFGYTWESTANRLGERAVLRSDIGLYLDEIGMGDPKAISQAIYKLAGGLDKGGLVKRSETSTSCFFRLANHRWRNSFRTQGQASWFVWLTSRP